MRQRMRSLPRLVGLALWLHHQDGTPPSGTAAWLAQGAYRGHYHLRHIRGLSRPLLYLDLGPPIVSMLGGRVMNRLLRSFYGDYGVGDTPAPLMPVRANLGNSGVFVPVHGALWRAVQVSSAVLSVLPPVAWDGDLLVDGGIVDNLPVGLVGASVFSGLDHRGRCQRRTATPTVARRSACQRWLDSAVAPLERGAQAAELDGHLADFGMHCQQCTGGPCAAQRGLAYPATGKRCFN